MPARVIRLPFYLLVLVLFSACQPSGLSPKPMHVPADALAQLAAFRARAKFTPADTVANHRGPALSNPALQAPLNELLNLAAADFAAVARQPAPSEGAFQAQIDHSLARFETLTLALDSEDQDQVCLYHEELMDIVGLASSGGRLSIWRYGFDPEALMRRRGGQ